MLYLAGDNNLFGLMERAIARLEDLAPDKYVDVVVLSDGLYSNYSWKFEVQPNGQYELGVNRWFLGEVNMADPRTLADFVSWAHEHYPAQHYYLAIADHGRATSGIAWDQTSGNARLGMADVESALRQATGDGNWRLDVVHYDACLMGLFEAAYDLQGFADYWVASQNQTWGAFPFEQYVQALHETPFCTPRELAVAVAARYFETVAISYLPRTIAAMDLSRAPHLLQAIDSMATLMIGDMPATRNQFQNARNRTQKYDSRHYTGINSDDEYLDIYHLAQRIAQETRDAKLVEACQTVMSEVQGMVIWEANYSAHQNGGSSGPYYDLSHSHGLSIYWPPDALWADYGRYVRGELFTCTEQFQWDEFLSVYHQTKGGVSEPIEPTMPPIWIPGVTE